MDKNRGSASASLSGAFSATEWDLYWKDELEAQRKIEASRILDPNLKPLGEMDINPKVPSATAASNSGTVEYVLQIPQQITGELAPGDPRRRSYAAIMEANPRTVIGVAAPGGGYGYRPYDPRDPRTVITGYAEEIVIDSAMDATPASASTVAPEANGGVAGAASSAIAAMASVGFVPRTTGNAPEASGGRAAAGAASSFLAARTNVDLGPLSIGNSAFAFKINGPAAAAAPTAAAAAGSADDLKEGVKKKTIKLIKWDDDDDIPRGPDSFKSLDAIIKERGIRKPKERGLTSARAENLRMSDEAAASSARTYGEFKLNKSLDPRSHSLDEIITKETAGSSMKRKIDEDEKEEEGYKRRGRTRVSFNDTVEYKEAQREVEEEEEKKPPVYCPSAYKAIGFLSEKGLIISIVVGKRTEFQEDRTRMWRCMVSCGEIKGVCDSERKTVAREMACHDFLLKLKDMYPEARVPKYALQDELLTDPRLLSILEDEALNHLVVLKLESRLKKVGGEPVYVCKYMVGNDGEQFYEAEGASLQSTQLQAAKQAYVAITGEEFPPVKYYLGEECDPKIEYDFNESEVHQTAAEVKK